MVRAAYVHNYNVHLVKRVIENCIINYCYQICACLLRRYFIFQPPCWNQRVGVCVTLVELTICVFA